MISLKQQILQLEGFNLDFSTLSKKEIQAIKKRFHQLIKELEHLMRTGGATLIIDEHTIITTYMNNSLRRPKRSKKVIY